MSFDDEVKESLLSIDGTAMSTVKLLTGFKEEEINNLGGIDEYANS